MANDFSLAKYLARIGLTRDVKPDIQTLASIQAAHVSAIPFEGLDPLLRRPVKLDLASLQSKLVDSARGGYCFEQNTLLKAALDAIGFRVTGLGGRVRWNAPADAPLGPREHMLLKVDLDEGPYLVDAGFGACLIDAPLRLAAGEQRTAMGTYRLTESGGLFTLAAKQPAGWRTAYVFDLTPQLPADYELGNWYTSTNPAAPFPNVLIMERVGGGQRCKLINRRFITEARDGEVLEERLMAAADQFGHVLKEVFGVISPVPVEALFARIES